MNDLPAGRTRCGMDFGDMVVFCGLQSGLVAQYERLTGRHLTKVARTGEMTDEGKAECAGFAAFVYECVWSRLPMDGVL